MVGRGPHCPRLRHAAPRCADLLGLQTRRGRVCPAAIAQGQPTRINCALVPRSFGNDGHESKQWARGIALNLHEDEGRLRSCAPESAGLWALPPHIAKLHDRKRDRLTCEQLGDMLHIPAVHPDIDLEVIRCSGIDDLQVEVLRHCLHLHDMRLLKCLGIGACCQRGVVQGRVAPSDQRCSDACADD